LGKYDQALMYMSSDAYSTFAEQTFTREKAVIEKLGLTKPQ
jgi:hypothetical protein